MDTHTIVYIYIYVCVCLCVCSYYARTCTHKHIYMCVCVGVCVFSQSFHRRRIRLMFKFFTTFNIQYLLSRPVAIPQLKSLVFWVLWHINLCRLPNAKSIFMKIVLFQTIQFNISTQFKCEKHFYFKLYSLVKQFYS